MLLIKPCGDPQAVFRPRLNQNFIIIIFISTAFNTYLWIDRMNVLPLVSSVTLGNFYLRFLGFVILIDAIKFDCQIFQLFFNSLNPFFKLSLSTPHVTEKSGATVDKIGLGPWDPLLRLLLPHPCFCSEPLCWAPGLCEAPSKKSLY